MHTKYLNVYLVEVKSQLTYVIATCLDDTFGYADVTQAPCLLPIGPSNSFENTYNNTPAHINLIKRIEKYFTYIVFNKT